MEKERLEVHLAWWQTRDNLTLQSLFNHNLSSISVVVEVGICTDFSGTARHDGVHNGSAAARTVVLAGNIVAERMRLICSSDGRGGITSRVIECDSLGSIVNDWLACIKSLGGLCHIIAHLGLDSLGLAYVVGIRINLGGDRRKLDASEDRAVGNLKTEECCHGKRELHIVLFRLL